MEIERREASERSPHISRLSKNLRSSSLLDFDVLALLRFYYFCQADWPIISQSQVLKRDRLEEEQVLDRYMNDELPRVRNGDEIA